MCIPSLYPDSSHPSLMKFARHAILRRRGGDDYYETRMGTAKEILACAIYGFATPRNSISPSAHLIPPAEWLAADVRIIVAIYVATCLT